ncbi:Protein D2 isoform X3 [Aphelenchoides fujianensis]|nr:Protein D2 isoform X3 [Aphelenchoides fujianensis]
MITKLVLPLLFVLQLAVAEETEAAFEKAGIVSDLLDVAPNTTLSVHYAKKGKKAELGNELRLSEVAEQPAVEWENDAGLYTLIKVDPDALSRTNPIYRSWLHWLVVNVPGDAVREGHEVVAYKGAGAPPKTGLHRYVFLVFKQQTPIGREALGGIDGDHRKNFDLRAFAAKNKLGDPIAGNFYEAQHEE